MISLITTDVGDTLGTFTKPTVKDILFDLSKIPAVKGKAHIVGEAARRFLHTTPELTDAVIWDLCGALLIDRRDWPDPWPRRANTEIETYADALEMFIQAGEMALPRLRPSASRVWAMPYQAGSAAGTWVICDAGDPITHRLLDDVVELHWGRLTWMITCGALARLLDRARRAEEVLRRRLDSTDTDDSDQEIPDREPEHDHATR